MYSRRRLLVLLVIPFALLNTTVVQPALGDQKAVFIVGCATGVAIGVGVTCFFVKSNYDGIKRYYDGKMLEADIKQLKIENLKNKGDSLLIQAYETIEAKQGTIGLLEKNLKKEQAKMAALEYKWGTIIDNAPEGSLAYSLKKEEYAKVSTNEQFHIPNLTLGNLLILKASKHSAMSTKNGDPRIHYTNVAGHLKIKNMDIKK